MPTSLIILFLVGLLGGFISGLLGIGGGIIFILVIPMALQSLGLESDYMVQYTIANSLFATLFAASAATATFIKNKMFFWREILVIGGGSVVIQLLTFRYIVNTPWYSEVYFNIIIVCLLLFMIYRTLTKKDKEGDDSVTYNRPMPVLGYLLVGMSAGVISAISGLGGGVVIIPLLSIFLLEPMKRTTAISLGVITITSLNGTIYNLFEDVPPMEGFASMGYIVFPVALALSLGVMISSPLGVHAARKAPVKILRLLFSFFLAVVIIRKCTELYFYYQS